MGAADILLDAFERVRDAVNKVIDGMTEEELAFRADSRANSIAWLVWHLTRVQDDHVAEMAKIEQVWVAAGWAQRMALELDIWDTGKGHKSKDVAMVRTSAHKLAGYHEAVFHQTAQYVRDLEGPALERVVDRPWGPPISVGARLLAVVVDDLQHIGQAAYVRGLVERRGAGPGAEPPAPHQPRNA